MFCFSALRVVCCDGKNYLFRSCEALDAGLDNFKCMIPSDRMIGIYKCTIIRLNVTCTYLQEVDCIMKLYCV